MAMTMQQIIAKSLPARRTSAANVTIMGIKAKKNRDGMPMVMAKTKSNLDNNDNVKRVVTTYVSTIEVYPKSKVIVSCSCDDFKFMWEVALYKKGAARTPEYANGEDPDTKNPTYIPGACKHLIAFGQALIQRGKL